MTYRVEGKDGFDVEAGYCPISEHSSYEDATDAAYTELARLNLEQPHAGGQAGIQDRVYIVHPDGRRERIIPESVKQPAILACIPVRDEKNLEYARKLGLGDNPPWLEPYADSTQDECQGCQGKLWIGPQQKARKEEWAATDDKVVVLCHLCTVLLVAATDGEVELTPLGGESTSYVPGTEPPKERAFEEEWRRAEDADG